MHNVRAGMYTFSCSRALSSNKTPELTRGFSIQSSRNLTFCFFHGHAAELVMHRERVERHCKGVTTSLNEFKARFQQMVEEHDKEVSQELPC